MAKIGSLFTVVLRRIEVHASVMGVDVDDDGPNPRWMMTIGTNGKTIFLSGYLRSAEGGSFGQAEAIGLVEGQDIERLRDDEAASELFLTWAAEHCYEVLYDTARRALQSQAALMDFSFEQLPIFALDPFVSIDLTVPATSEDEEQASEDEEQASEDEEQASEDEEQASEDEEQATVNVVT